MIPIDAFRLRMNGSLQAVLSEMKEIDQEIDRIEQKRERLWTTAVVVFVVGVASGLLLLVFVVGLASGLLLRVPGILALFILAPIVLCPLGICFWLAMPPNPRVLHRRFVVVQEILLALRDDAERVVGLLDLTSPYATSKRVRTARSGGGKRKAYYRNPWLRIKLKLVEGNLLQLSLVDKIKTKSGSAIRRSTKIAAKLVINTDLYAQSQALSELHVPGYEVSSGPDHVLLTGYSQDLSVELLLSKIQMLFSYLEPVGQAVVPGS